MNVRFAYMMSCVTSHLEAPRQMSIAGKVVSSWVEVRTMESHHREENFFFLSEANWEPKGYHLMWNKRLFYFILFYLAYIYIYIYIFVYIYILVYIYVFLDITYLYIVGTF